MNKAERNITLDYFKLFLTLLVILIHMQPLFSENSALFRSFIGWEISNGLARIAVPCFFIINGYYMSSKNNLLAIKRLSIVYIVWTLIYLPFFVYENKGIIIINILTGYHHLWYIAALLGAYILFLVLKRLKIKDKYLLVASVLLFGAGYTISKIEFDKDIWNFILSRNFLFMGFPFVFIGYYINKYQLSEQIKSCKLSLIVVFIVIFLMVLFFESYLLLKGYNSGISDFYISLIFLCPLLFLFILKISKVKAGDAYLSHLATGVFFSHQLVLNLISNNSDNYIIKLPQIIFLSLILSIGIMELNKRIKIFL